MKMRLELGKLMPQLDAKVRDGVHTACKAEGLDTDNAFVERSVHAEKARTNQLDEGSRAALKYVSTRTCDAEGDVVVPEGIVLKEFMKNPVFFWGHNYSLPPLGSDEAVDIRPEGLLVKSVYGDTGAGTMADVVWRLVQQGHQKQSSIGYVPLKLTKKTDNRFSGELDVLQKSWPELGESRKNVKRILHKVLMLEHSDVGLGMNRDTTVLQVAKGLGATDLLFKQMGFVVGEEKEAGVDGVTTDDTSAADETMAAELVCPACGATAKGKPGKLCPKCGEAMRAKAAEATEEDESPAKLYACVEGDPEMKSSYKLPHHRESDGALEPERLREAMGLLLGARGGVTLSAKGAREAYAHLALHYEAQGWAVPELREYTQGELRKAYPSLYESAYVRPVFVAQPVARVVQVKAAPRVVMSVGELVERAVARKLGRV